jgi:hypothetical protein
MLRQYQQFTTESGESVVARFQTEVCGLGGDPGEQIPAAANNINHSDIR